MSDELTFDRAEPAEGSEPPALRCGACDKTLETAYFEAAGKIFCPQCKAQLAEAVSAGGNYLRSVLFGAGGALLGALIYFGVSAATGYEIGLIAILVGWLVGKGVATGSGGMGGRKYQVTAVLLTYLAISISYGGLVVKELATNSAVTDPLAAGSSAEPASENPAAAVPEADEPSGTPTGGGMAMAGLLLSILALPILIGLSDLPGSLLGLMIVAFGLWQAWKMNQRPVITISGPFSVATRPPTA